MIISAIVAKTRNNVIGKDNKMPWHISEDLKYFKKITSGHAIILGRKNYESIGRPLPNRINIVLTKNKSFDCPGCIKCSSIEEALKFAYDQGEKEAFIIGGGQIYEQSKEYWDRIYITEINTELEGDVFFPIIDKNEWNLISHDCHEKSEKNEYDFCFDLYERTNPI